MKGLRIGCTLLLLMMAASATAAGKTYRWVDSAGKVHYGDQPPPNATAVTEKPVSTSAATTGDDAAKPGVDAAECERRNQKLNQYRNAAAITETDGLGNKREYTETERQKLVERAEQSVRDGGCAQ